MKAAQKLQQEESDSAAELDQLKIESAGSLSDMMKQASFYSESGDSIVPLKSKQELEKATKKLLKDNSVLNVGDNPVQDIRGNYFNEHDQMNTIDDKFTVKLGNSSVTFTMKPIGKKLLKNNVLSLKVDLVESKQESVLDDPCIEELIPEENVTNDKEKIMKCELDSQSGDLIWSSGAVWFKKDWSLLVGAWSDPENNLIEIRPDNALRYIDGYGPFPGEFIGFQKFHVKMPNGKFMVGNLLGHKEIKWQNGEKWTRCSDKGCLIM